MKQVTLYGRIFVTGAIRAVTGLHIGGSPAPLAIGALDNPVIRDGLDNRPYIPGSSVRGKMRSLWERANGSPQNFGIGQGVHIHVCEHREQYERCPVCQIYGVPGQLDASSPTRLSVRDCFLTEESEEDLRLRARTDQLYTEVKWEAAIDRVTSAATPRQMERVPAGAVFGPFELVYSCYEVDDIKRFGDVFASLQLLEDDYLGGQGSRGSGKVAFERLSITCRTCDDYGDPRTWSPQQDGLDAAIADVQDVLSRRTELEAWLVDEFEKVIAQDKARREEQALAEHAKQAESAEQ